MAVLTRMINGLSAYQEAQTLDMADAQVALTLTHGTGTQITSNIMYVDPNSAGGSEDLLLPPEDEANGVVLHIVNTAGAAEDIVIKEDGDATTIATIGQNEEALCVCDGVTWRGSVLAATAELDFISGVTAGTAAASKALVLDASKDIATIRHLTISGNLVTGATTLSEAELGASDGVTLGTAAASKNLTLDANAEMNSLGVIKVADKLVATADVLALNATPITVLPAVGAGVFAEFLGAYVFLDVSTGTTAYTVGAGEDLIFQELSAGRAVSHSIDATELDGTADALCWAGPKAAEESVLSTMVDNGGFEVTIQSGEWADGDYDIKIRLYYREIRLASMEAIT